MAITWQATSEFELLEEYQKHLVEIQNKFMQKISQAQAKGDTATLQKLTQDMQKTVQELAITYQEKAKTLANQDESASLYNQKLCKLDLDLTVYDGDRDYFKEFNLEPNIQKAYQEIKKNNPVFQSRKHLLKSSLRLTPKLAPAVYSIGEQCQNALGLKTDIEFYVYQNDIFNAACYPPDDKRLYIIVTSGLLERFSQDELTFVIGHEIGHALFEHHRYPAEHILEIGQSYLSPLHAMKLFAWKRNAEISADRVGILCCQDFDAAGRTFFKLSSGVTSESLDFHLKEYIKQFVDLENILSNSEIDPEDWYSSHPFSPLRIKALEIFHTSQTYHKLIGKKGGKISEEAMENNIQKFLSLMEPSYLDEQSEIGTMLQRYLFLAGYLITLADGQILDSEIQALGELVKPEIFSESLTAINGLDFEDIQNQVEELAAKLNTFLSPVQKLNILRDLAVITYADGEVDEKEMELLYYLCHLFNIRPEFADQVIHDAQQSM